MSAYVTQPEELCVLLYWCIAVYLGPPSPPSALREPTAMHTTPQKQPKQTPHETDCYHQQTAMPIDDPDPLLGPAEAPLGMPIGHRTRARRHG